MSDEWEEVTLGNTWDFTKDKELIGLYLGKEEGVGENASTMFSFEVDHQNMSVWGSTVLDGKMKNVKVGEEVKITFLGLKDSPNRKGKQYKDFKVEHRAPSFEEA